MIYLQHISFGNDDNRFINILKDGYLRPGSKTKQSGLYGSNNAKWIYLRINTDINRFDKFAHFYFDNSLLLKTKFVLNISWITEDNLDKKDIIDGTKLTKEELNELLTKFKKQAYDSFIQKKCKVPVNMSNEILVKNDINLHKYLVGISKYLVKDKDKKTKELAAFINENYKNVKMM